MKGYYIRWEELLALQIGDSVPKKVSCVNGMGAVNVLASNNSTPKVGTTVHTIAHTNVCCKFHICNVCHN